MSDVKAVRTETTVRTFNGDGDVISEKLTIVMIATPAADEASDDQTGMYL